MVGIKEKLKGFYFSLEDKWYAVIDKVDSKVPVYGIVDKVDKVVPSFLLFIIVVLLLAAFFLLPLLGPAGAVFSFKVTDNDDAAVSGATVEIFLDNAGIFSGTTNQNGETQQVALPLGKEIGIKVSKAGFVEYEEAIMVENSVLLYGITLYLLEEKTYNIALKDSLGQPIRQPLTLSFTCANSKVNAPADITITSGLATVTEPAGCNGLVASIVGAGYERKDSVSLVQNQQTIYLQETVGSTGKANVELYFNGQLVSESLTVYLYKDNGTESGLGPVDSAASQNGTASFDAQPGAYFIRTGAGVSYSAAQSDVFTISAGGTSLARIDLEKNIVGTVRLKITDKVTKGAVDGARVLLRLGTEEIDTKVSDAENEGIVEFPVSADTAYSVVVDHEAYCLKILENARIASIATEIELIPYTQDCGGTLRVKVLDQGGRPVRNAVAGLYTEDGFSVGFATILTDANGNADFTRVASGDYKAFAYKAGTSGWSDSDSFSQRAAEKTVLTVVLVAGNGTVAVNVRDEDGNPLQFSHVTFYDSLTLQATGCDKPGQCGAMVVQDANGTVELVTRADKSVYIFVEKPGYADFTSTVVPVSANTVQAINAVLEKEIIQGEIKIELKGVYKDGKAVSVLAPGKEYDAVFQLRVPSNKSYDSIGMHARTGTHEIMELDKIIIKGINAPGKAEIIKATSYSESRGYAYDSANLTADDAKWANLRWSVVPSGIMEIAVKIKVKENASAGEQLNLFYRAWAEDNGVYKRDPVDNDLGQAESASGKEALYANTKETTFQIGNETICDKKFCFDSSLLDVEEAVVESATGGFSASVFKKYKLNFTILNNSGFETDSYMNSETRATGSSSLLMQSYAVYGAQNQSRAGTAKDNSTGWIETGNMLKDNRISGSVEFTPQKSGLSSITIEMKSNQSIQFSKTIPANIAAEKQMEVSVSPEILPSGIENMLEITVKDKETGAEIEGAVAKAKDRFGVVVAEKTTNSRGFAVIRLPALQPGEKLSLLIGKQNYESFEKTLEVNPAVIEAKPAAIGVALNAKTIFETQDNFTLENITAFGVKIKKIEVNGKLYGLVDREKMNNWLASYVGETIAPGEVKEMVLESFLTEKGKKIPEPRQLEATLDITTEAYVSEWVTSIPVKISVGLGGEVDDPTCFTITRKEWKAGTEGTPIEIQLDAQNNCSVGGVPVSLRNVAAQAKWETNQVGTLSLTTAQNAVDIPSGYPNKFAGTIAPRESISIVLTFTPNGGINGKGIVKIIFSAENPTESGLQGISDQISAELTVVNLADCIAFSKDVLIIKPEKSDTFEIETLGCGPSNRFRLESELTVSQKEFTMQEKETKKVEVLAEKNIAGQYPINIYAKGSDQTQEKLIKTVNARILADGCIELSKYEFDIFDNPNDPYDGYDTAEVINHCYDKFVTVTVKYDEHSWGDALATGAVWGVIGALAGGVLASATGANIWTGAAAASTETTWAQFAAGSAAGAGITNTTKGKTVTYDGKDYFQPEGSQTVYGKGEDGKPVENSVNTTGFGPWKKTTVTPVNPAGTGGTSGGTGGTGSTGGTTNPSGTPRNPGDDPFGTADFVLASPTGYASLGDSGMLGSLAGGALGAVGNIIGPPSVLGWGFWGLAVGTIFTYMNQDEGEFSFTAIKEDLVYKGINLLMPGATLEDNKLVEEPSTDIIVRDLDETSTSPRLDEPKLSTETRIVGFLNAGKVVQEDPSTPLYRVLRVDGERLDYVTTYEIESNEYPSLQIKERTQHKERIRLQFNAFDPMATVQPPHDLPNCTLGTITGVTGPNAVPKILLDWDWSTIKENSCDEGNPDYVYCDATQFSIEILKKVQALRTFIEGNKPFDCPSQSGNVASKEQLLVGTAYDVGITKIQANLVSDNDINVSVAVESNNARQMDVELKIDVKKGATLVKSCLRNMSVISRAIASCEFRGIADGDYTIEARITPELCQGCENNQIENDSISAGLAVGPAGIAQCEPFTTKRLVQFLEASNYSQAQIEKVQKLVKFNAYIMKDAYTADFRNDFDEYCRTKSFFDCPSYYLEDDGLGQFFSSQDKFKFDYSLGPQAPADAGKYSVTINIEFDNSNWDFFSGGVPDATVRVEMTELSAPEPDSPFYYLPFDGLVGVDSANGRQGYGINFRQTSQETIKINNSTVQPIISSNIAGSTPMFNGWIDAGFADDFGILNQVKRGILLDVQAGAESASVVLSPSYATPIMMQVDYSTGLDAFAFYSIELDNAPQASFTKIVPWSGVGPMCRDFADNVVTEAWQDTWDKHGGISGNLLCAVGTGITDYGIEWCNPKRSGSVYLQSVVFTPQGKNGIMRKSAYSDSMVLYNSDDAGSQIGLNGVPGMKNNSYGTDGIESIEDVFELVKDSKVCLIGQGNRISNRFFWNPKAVLEEISALKAKAQENCIKSS